MGKYNGGAVVTRSTDLTGQNFTNAWFALTWQQSDFDYGGPEAQGNWWSSDEPTKLVVPTYLDARRAVLRANFNVSWNNVAIGTDWLNMGIQLDGEVVSMNSQPGGIEVVNPVLGLRSRQFLASQGQALTATVRWRNTETSVDVVASKTQTWFEVEILGFIF